MSTSATAALEQELQKNNQRVVKLIQDVPTHWNSTNQMLERFLEIADAVMFVMIKMNINLPFVNANDILLVQDLINCLKPLQSATNQISGETYVTASLCVPLSTEMLENFQKEDFNLNTDADMYLKEFLIKIVKSRPGPYETNPLCGYSTIFDPRFKNLAFHDNTNVTRNLLGVQNLLNKRHWCE